MTKKYYFLPVMPATRRVAIFAFDDVQLLDATGPASVFGVANSVIGRRVYDVQVVSPSGGAITSSCGVVLQTQPINDMVPRKIDTLLVSGASVAVMQKVSDDRKVQAWMSRCFRASTRFGSICSGAFLLARWGALKGLRVATHWASCDALAQQFPDLRVDSESLFVTDGKVWTSAGVTSGIDMALAMVEQDIDRVTADRIAKFLVLYARRPGYQSQFSDVLRAQISADSGFAELAGWAQQNLARRLDVPALAARSGFSERTFYRKFLAATGQTPAHFVESIRLDAARTMLATDLPLKTIARQTGLGSLARLNKAFERRFGVTPAFFRKMHTGTRA